MADSTRGTESRSHPAEQRIDLHQLAASWLELVQPLRIKARATRRRSSRYALPNDIDPLLKGRPLDPSAGDQRPTALAVVEPIQERATACILGIPGDQA